MAMKLAYNTLEYGPTPDLPQMLAELKQAGWEGWEVRQPGVRLGHSVSGARSSLPSLSYRTLSM